MEEILMTNIKKNNCGRPAGRIKTAKIEISIEPTVKDECMYPGLKCNAVHRICTERRA